MITVTVTTGDPPRAQEVNVAGFGKLTPKSARAALEIVGERVGRVEHGGWYVMVYENTVSNKFRVGVGRSKRRQQAARQEE